MCASISRIKTPAFAVGHTVPSSVVLWFTFNTLQRTYLQSYELHKGKYPIILFYEYEFPCIHLTFSNAFKTENKCFMIVSGNSPFGSWCGTHFSCFVEANFFVFFHNNVKTFNSILHWRKDIVTYSYKVCIPFSSISFISASLLVLPYFHDILAAKSTQSDNIFLYDYYKLLNIYRHHNVWCSSPN